MGLTYVFVTNRLPNILLRIQTFIEYSSSYLTMVIKAESDEETMEWYASLESVASADKKGELDKLIQKISSSKRPKKEKRKVPAPYVNNTILPKIVRSLTREQQNEIIDMIESGELTEETALEYIEKIKSVELDSRNNCGASSFRVGIVAVSVLAAVSSAATLAFWVYRNRGSSSSKK